MTRLLTADQMRRIERAAIDSGAVTGLELMERAGRGVVEAIFAHWPALARAPRRGVVLCGPGNNGGDGFVIARLLREWGWDMSVYLYGDPARLPPDAKTNHARWCEMGAVSAWGAFDPASEAADLYVDAVFGAGLTRAPSAEVLAPWEALAQYAGRTAKIVAIDAPTGLCMDSGRVLADPPGAVRADLTVTFQHKRLGHFLAEGPDYCGAVRCVDIGVGWSADAGETAELIAPPLKQDLAKVTTGHKYDHGHALILSGPMGAGGAARLAARAALRTGAGLVSVVAEAEAVAEHAAQLTAVMVKHAQGAEGLAGLLEDARLNALCLGPGLGLARARALVPVALGGGGQIAHPTRKVVLDADALTAFADAPETLFALLHSGCVLTPHGGEFARLFPDIAERLKARPVRGPAYSKLQATKDAAARAGCTVLFKGADSVIAEASGRSWVLSSQYDDAAPWLATGGSGDVLAGMITGLLARGMATGRAVATGAWLHAAAARRFGPGLIAEDLPDALPGVFRDLGL